MQWYWKMINFKFVGFSLVVYVSHKVNVLVTDIILDITSQEHLIFTSLHIGWRLFELFSKEVRVKKQPGMPLNSIYMVPCNLLHCISSYMYRNLTVYHVYNDVRLSLLIKIIYKYEIKYLTTCASFVSLKYILTRVVRIRPSLLAATKFK